MTFRAKFIGGTNDGLIVESDLPSLPDLVHGGDSGNYMYLSDKWYMLTGIDLENNIGYYEPTSLQNFPDGSIGVVDGEIKIEKNTTGDSSPIDGLTDEVK